jgi:hypothetical protein
MENELMKECYTKNAVFGRKTLILPSELKLKITGRKVSPFYEFLLMKSGQFLANKNRKNISLC